jgi:aromatic ring hydroxylase
MLMNAADYRESLRRYSPRVFVNGRRVDSVADEPSARRIRRPRKQKNYGARDAV